MRHQRDRIGRVRAHVAAHLAGDLSLDALADVACLSRFHFHRVWRATTGETARETVRRARLNRAAVLVVTTALPFAEVARQVGLGDADALARAFRAAWGITPRESRARSLAPPPLLPPPPGVFEMPDAILRDEPRLELAALSHRGPYDRIGRSFDDLMGRLARAGIAPTGPVLDIDYDDPEAVPPEELRAHACVGVAASDLGRLPEGVERVAIPGGRTAVLTHRGPYGGLSAAWRAAYRWLAEAGEVPGEAPPYERYLNDPRDAAPDDLLTEICVPLAPRA